MSGFLNKEGELCPRHTAASALEVQESLWSKSPLRELKIPCLLSVLVQ